MSLDVYFRFLIALVIVVALIGALAWLVKRFGWGRRFIATSGTRRLAVLEVLPLDGKRRLILLRRDQAEHLVLLGSERDLLIESGIETRPAAQTEFQTLVEASKA
jgi:flagellar protein FliO/FliZ